MDNRREVVSRRVSNCFTAIPPDLLVEVMKWVLDFDGTRRYISVLARVSRQWYSASQHVALWEHIARRDFVAYPLVQLVRLRLEHEKPLHTKCTKRALEPPSNTSVRQGLRAVERYLDRKAYQDLVRRRRTFVLHAFLSLTLLLLTLSLVAAMCAAEGLQPTSLCSADTSFSFLWLTYVSVLGTVIANIVMQTHFEPKPLLSRVMMHTHLIQASTGALALGLIFVALPTALAQAKIQESLDISWMGCAMPVLTALVFWQLEVLYTTRHDIARFARRVIPRSIEIYHAVAYATPTLFACSLMALCQYVDTKERILLVAGSLPFAICVFTLTIVFLLDFCAYRRRSDCFTLVALLIADTFPLSTALMPWRGYLLLPLVGASFTFFCGHFTLLRQMFDAAMFDPDGDTVLFVHR